MCMWKVQRIRLFISLDQLSWLACKLQGLTCLHLSSMELQGHMDIPGHKK